MQKNLLQFNNNFFIQIPIPEINHEYANTTGIYTGLSLETLTENLYPQNFTDYTTHKMVDFATIFSVIFSGLTGIMNGANMSGKKYAKSSFGVRGKLICITL